MQITIQISGDKLLHAKPSQFGAIVAHVVKSTKFHNVQVFKTMIAVSFNLGDFGTLSALQDRAESVEKDILALLDLDPFPCPCGCGQFLAIGPCLVQSGEVSPDGLTQDEIDLCRGGLRIQAIKLIRARTGAGLKEAKDATDKHWRTDHTQEQAAKAIEISKKYETPSTW